MSSGVHTFFTSSPIVNDRRGARTSQRHWSNRRCEPPQIGPHDKGAIERDLHLWQRSNTVGLEHLTKGQQRGFARLSGCVDWAKALDKGADRAENLLTRFFWQCELSDCWELNYSKHSPGNHRIPFKQTAESGDQQKTGGWKTSSSFEIWAWLGSFLESFLITSDHFTNTNTNTNYLY